MHDSDSDEPLLTHRARDDWVAAIHEAGHAVAACLCGFELTYATIDGAYRCRAYLTLAQGDRDTGLLSLTLDEEARDAIYTLAGGRSELLIEGSDGVEALSTSDREHFTRLNASVDERERNEWRAKMEIEKDDLLRRHWASVEAVARILLVTRHLSGARVAAIVWSRGT